MNKEYSLNNIVMTINGKPIKEFSVDIEELPPLPPQWIEDEFKCRKTDKVTVGKSIRITKGTLIIQGTITKVLHLLSDPPDICVVKYKGRRMYWE